MLNDHFVARLQIARRFARETDSGGRSGGHHVARFQRHYAR